MEVLTKAAVTEICQLVDDGYAVLRLEISRSEKENQSLKRKMQMLELMVTRGYNEAGLRDTSAANIRPDGAPAFGESRVAERAAERAFGSPLGISLWKDGEPSAVDVEDASLASPMRDECTDLEEGASQSLLIKEEAFEEDLEHSHPQEPVEPDGGERVPIAEPPVGKGPLTEQPGTRHGDWDDGGLDTVLKAEPEIKTVNLEHTGAVNGAGRLNILDYEDIIPERSAQVPFSMDGIPEKDKEEAACSYPVESDTENLSVHSELLSGKSLSSLGSLDMKREDETIDSELLKVEAEIRSAWSKEIMSGAISSQHSYYGKDWESDELLLESDVCPSQTEMAIRDNTADIRPNALGINGWAPYDKSSIASRTETRATNAREERFICTCCGKSFSCQNVFEAHQRTHAAEKPFNCSQCGKRFAQLSNLITHRRVHTGEKPYSCTHCGKQFAQSRYLVTHLRIHTGEKPFSCTQCGKRFAQSNNLVRHQSVHTGKKPFRCSQCGKSFTTSSHRKRHESVHSGGRPYTCTL